jgi:hypothetical protein
MNESLKFVQSVSPELIMRRWKEARPYYTVNQRAGGAWRETSWWRRPSHCALELHWRPRAPSNPGEELSFCGQAKSVEHRIIDAPYRSFRRGEMA